MPAPPRHPTPPFNNLHPHDRKNTAVLGISISHMRNQSSGNHPGEQISSLHCVSINNTTIYSNEPVRVRPNPRPQKRGSAVWSGLVPKNKRNNKPNHKQFIIHESINTHSTEQDELPAAKQRKVADTNGRLLHDTAQMAHLSCVGQKAMDDVIRQNVEQETENSVNDVSAFISKNKMNDDF